MGFERLERNIIEVIKECCNAFKGRLALVLNLDSELYLCLADAAEILDIVEDGLHADRASCDYRHTEFHLVKTVIHELCHIVYLYGVIPQLRKE